MTFMGYADGRPCIDCTAETGRRVGCHDGTCERERAWLKEYRAKQAVEYEARNRESLVDDFKMKSIIRDKRRRRLR